MDQFLAPETDTKRQFLEPETDVKCQFLLLGPETDILCQFLEPETDIMGERNFMRSSTVDKLAMHTCSVHCVHAYTSGDISCTR